MSGDGRAGRGAWDRCQPPPVVPPSLAELRGPTAGTVTLPLWIQWSGLSTYDLNVVDDVVWMYSRVIREASSVSDLQAYLNGERLVILWPQLRLPVRHLVAWEEAFDQLQRPEGLGG